MFSCMKIKTHQILVKMKINISAFDIFFAIRYSNYPHRNYDVFQTRLQLQNVLVKLLYKLVELTFRNRH